ncbi:MAG: hypothetical protein WC679_00305 [Bacteroidales bacterium]|jgi:hypothetical protein
MKELKNLIEHAENELFIFEEINSSTAENLLKELKKFISFYDAAPKEIKKQIDNSRK